MFFTESDDTKELMLQEYSTKWIIHKPSHSTGRSIQSHGFYPVPNMDLKFCFEIFYEKEIQSADGRSSNTLFKLALIKLIGLNIPACMEMRIDLAVFYGNGVTIFKEFKPKNPFNVNSIDNLLCLNDTVLYKKWSSDYCCLRETEHGTWMIRSDALVLKCQLIFSGHLNSVSHMLNNEQSLSNLKEFCNFKPIQESSEFSDIVIRVENETLPAHKLVLAAHSPVFKKMISSDFVESKTNSITIRDCDVHAFKCFLGYLYSGEIGDTAWPTLTALYVLADKYDVACLKRSISEIMMQQLSLENIYEVLTYAYVYNDKYLQIPARRFAALHIEQLKTEKEWAELVHLHPNIGYEILAYAHGLPTSMSIPTDA